MYCFDVAVAFNIPLKFYINHSKKYHKHGTGILFSKINYKVQILSGPYADYNIIHYSPFTIHCFLLPGHQPDRDFGYGIKPGNQAAIRGGKYSNKECTIRSRYKQ